MDEIKEMLQRILDTLERIEKKSPDQKTVKTIVEVSGEEYQAFTRNAC